MALIRTLCSSIVNALCLPLHLIEAVGLFKIYKRFFAMCWSRISFTYYNKKMYDKKKELFRSLSEFNIFLKGGAFFFLEHVVGDPSTWTCFFQHVLQPPWYYFGDGCQVIRETWKYLEEAGFSDLKLRHIEAPVWFIIKPHIVGYAVK